MSKQFFVVSEARADFITATELADRVLLAEIAWLDDALIDSQRQWVGEDSPGVHLAWATMSHRAREIGIRAQGHFNGKPGLPDALAARRAILYILKKFDEVDAIVLVRDADDQNERRDGLEQARAADRSGKTIIIGVAFSKRECWIICGFDPIDDEERRLLDSERQRLGGDPCLRSHNLTAKSEIADHSAKRVLKVLSRDNWERQRTCWKTTSLHVLRERGADNGLTAYLEEIKVHLTEEITGREVGH
jgi:hypothetical protein